MWKPQILVSIVILGAVALVAILTGIEYGEVVATGCVVGISTLGMKLAEK